MKPDLRPYPDYKPSSIPWLGRVPVHWEVRRLRNASEMRVSNVDKHTKANELPVRLCNYVDVYKHDRISASMPFMSATATRDEIDKFRLERDDVLITKDSESWNDIGVPSLVEEPADDLICGYHLALLRPVHSQAKGAFLFRALQSVAVAYQFHLEAKGVTRFGLSHGAIKSVVVPLPPLPEQIAIVRYLDYTDRRIQRYLRAKQKLITLLEEQKQAIIHQAVTGQIDVRTGQPYPAYQASGVEWLGEVPERWEVQKLRRCVTVSGGMTPSMEVRRFWGGPIPWVTPKDMKRAVISDSSVRVTDSAIQETPLRLTEPPAVLIVVRGMILARRVPIASTTAPVTINQDMKALRTAKGTNAAFLAQLLDSAQEAFMPLIDEAGHGTRRLPMERWRELVIAIPPEEEQVAIVEHLDNRTAAVDATISHTQRQIDLLSEYRTRLISDVVTGKLDVREAAAALPEVDPLETEADSEEPLGTDVESNLDELGTKVKEVAT